VQRLVGSGNNASAHEQCAEIYGSHRRDENGCYVATVPDLRGCHTHAKDLDTLMKRIREVIQLCLEINPAALSLEFVGVQQISI